MLLIDAANVIGSRPTGWWRDRPAAARELTRRIKQAIAEGKLLAAERDAQVVLVSADRHLAEPARRGGAEVVGPTWLLGKLPA